MFHIELRQFPNSARRFNLSAQQLEAEVLEPWRGRRVVEIDEHKYQPERAKLRILEGPELAIAEIGLGRGWQNAERAGVDVTERLLAAPAGPEASDAVAEFKLTVQGACALDPRPLSDVVRLAVSRHPGARASEHLALAERAVWELLHQGGLELVAGDGDEPVAPDRWEALVLRWESWVPGGAVAARTRAGAEVQG